MGSWTLWLVVSQEKIGKAIDADENSNINKVNKYQALVRPEAHP